VIYSGFNRPDWAKGTTFASSDFSISGIARASSAAWPRRLGEPTAHQPPTARASRISFHPSHFPASIVISEKVRQRLNNRYSGHIETSSGGEKRQYLNIRHR
jgi:hypothetical protein